MVISSGRDRRESQMLQRKLITICVCAFLLGLPGIARGQQPKSIVASANGEGTIRLGKEEFKLHAVVVKLLEDGKAEIHLITDITVFVAGTWSRGDDADKSIKLTTTASNMEGGGKLFFGEDRKSIAGLKLEIFNKISKKTIMVDFVAK
jgi:hypothetical protein